MLLETPLANELRGVRALDARDWTSAAGYFRKGMRLEERNTLLRRSLQHKLGTALYLSGDIDGAAREFEAVVEAAPVDGPDEATAKAHYSLGVILMSRGRSVEAASHFGEAVRFQPTYLEARLALAEVLRRTGRIRESLPHYAAALSIAPAAPQARLGYALALIRLERYRDARDELTESVSAFPDRPELAHVLARLLAVAPDDDVRDGAAALRLLDRLLTGTRTTELGETMAMALAEVGEYERAASVQRGVLEVVRRGGTPTAARRIEENLRRYERRMPGVAVWDGDGLAGG